MVGAHNRDNVIAVLAGIDDFVNFRVRATGFHVEPIGVNVRQTCFGNTRQAKARDTAVASFQSVKHKTGGPSGDNVIDMSGDAIGVNRHKFNNRLRVCGGEHVLNEAGNPGSRFLHRDIIEVAVFKAKGMHGASAYELAGSAPFLFADGTEVGMIIRIHAGLAGRQGNQVQLSAGFCLHQEGAARAKGFVIGVSKDPKNNLFHESSIIREMTDGILLIDKPADMTSFGVVARVRRVLSQAAGKKVKVGHTGTLDPFATGLMIIVVGKECKKAGIYTKLDKVYEATFVLGQTSSTGDPEGEVTNVSTLEPTREQVEQALAQWTGEIQQRPPIFSAIKIDGQRAYKLARNGDEIDMPLRTVMVHSLELIDYTYPEVKIRTHVSSGTYIRSLASDIGLTLETGAYCTQLRRTAIAEWVVDDAQTLADLGVVS